MKVSEIFYSLQGEGFLAGMPGAFIRLAGCPLRCRFCDTKYAWDENAGTDYTIDKIIETIDRFNTEFVIITGGEPMTNPELPLLADKLKSRDKHITIETAGFKFVENLPCDLMSISPKLNNSAPTDPDLAAIHEKTRLNLSALRKLLDNYQYQLKFVVDSEDDLPQILQTLEQLGNVDSTKVMLMPQAATRDEFLAKAPMVAELCKQTHLTFCQRLHLLLWNNKKNM